MLNDFKEIKHIREFFKKTKKEWRIIMNKQQERQILKGLYNAAINCILKAVDDRHDAIYDYEKYLETVESTVQVFSQDFDLERDLKLVLAGLDGHTLGYLTTLDRQSQRETLDFFKDLRSALERITE